MPLIYRLPLIQTHITDQVLHKEHEILVFGNKKAISIPHQWFTYVHLFKSHVTVQTAFSPAAQNHYLERNSSVGSFGAYLVLIDSDGPTIIYC